MQVQPVCTQQWLSVSWRKEKKKRNSSLFDCATEVWPRSFISSSWANPGVLTLCETLWSLLHNTSSSHLFCLRLYINYTVIAYSFTQYIEARWCNISPCRSKGFNAHTVLQDLMKCKCTDAGFKCIHLTFMNRVSLLHNYHMENTVW